MGFEWQQSSMLWVAVVLSEVPLNSRLWGIFLYIIYVHFCSYTEVGKLHKPQFRYFKEKNQMR